MLSSKCQPFCSDLNVVNLDDRICLWIVPVKQNKIVLEYFNKASQCILNYTSADGKTPPTPPPKPARRSSGPSPRDTPESSRRKSTPETSRKKSTPESSRRKSAIPESSRRKSSTTVTNTFDADTNTTTSVIIVKLEKPPETETVLEVLDSENDKEDRLGTDEPKEAADCSERVSDKEEEEDGKEAKLTKNEPVKLPPIDEVPTKKTSYRVRVLLPDASFGFRVLSLPGYVCPCECVCVPVCVNPKLVLTHWGRVTHICVGNLTIIGSDNGLSPSHYLNQCWNIVNWTLRNKLQWNSNRNSKFSFKKTHLKMSPGKWRPFVSASMC